MSEAKNIMLEKIQKALINVPDDEKPADLKVPRTYRQRGERSRDERITLFMDRASEYKATVQQTNENKLPEIIVESFRSKGVEKLVIPHGFPSHWIPDGINPLYDDPESPLSHHDLDDSDAVITTCALAIAQTGTIILDTGKGQGRRVLTLLPDYHLCIIRADQIVELVPEGFAHLQSKVYEKGVPITFISGPSATSDIELNRVEGVHGPRSLQIFIINARNKRKP